MLSKTIHEYQDLLPPKSAQTLVYGPFTSRRYGLALGVNLLGPKKLCSFDCGYCDLGPTEIKLSDLKSEIAFPAVDVIANALQTQLLENLRTNGPVRSILISGNGEPTLHPQFADCIVALMHVRDQLAPQMRLILLSNGQHLDSRKTQEACNRLDERVVKLDAGNDRIFKVLNRPLSRTSIDRLAKGIRALKDVQIQSLFVQGVVDNTQSADIEDWLEVVGMIRPQSVQITTFSRAPWMSGLKRPDEDTLYSIAAKLKRRLNIDAGVFI